MKNYYYRGGGGLLAGGGVAAYMLLGKDSSTPAVEGAGTGPDQAEQPQEVEVDPIYLALDPAFVVNFENNGSLRYLQLEPAGHGV